MNEGIKSLKKNAIWNRVNLPAGKKHVGCKWVYADGITDKFKPKLGSNGYNHK